MREISRVYDKEATRLKDDEINLIVKREMDGGRDVAVIYILGQND